MWNQCKSTLGLCQGVVDLKEPLYKALLPAQNTMSSLTERKLSITALSYVFISLLRILMGQNTLLTPVDAKSNVHIVYIGKTQHDDIELVTQTHHEMLTAILGSKEAAADSMVYSYKHAFSGFAAKLTESQAKEVSELPGVIQVLPNYLHRLQTTRSWDYLGLSSLSPTNLVINTKMGKNAIIGLLDSGVWPESEVFSDKDLGPIPSRWKGVCESGELFNATKHCNRKLIGARYFVKGFQAEYGRPLNTSEIQEYLSPRDLGGHGTHTSTIAAGSFVPNVSYKGLGQGTVRGGAPGAHLAMYKVCWNLYGGVCASSDILKAFDEAVHDGVDVLSVSIGSDIPQFSNVDKHDGISIGSFHAVAKGITVVCAAGNEGPGSQTVLNTAPWILTVAAISVDRSFPTPIILGNNQTIIGQAMFTGKGTRFTNLVYPEVPDVQYPRYCESLSPNDTFLAGNVVLCFTSEGSQTEAAEAVSKAGGVGMVVAAKNPIAGLSSYSHDFPCVLVDYEIGTRMLYYIRTARLPKVRLIPSQTLVGKPVSTNVAYFSSRGPSSVAPAILKPDIAAPGANILAAIPPSDPTANNAFAFWSGTSMATPHISGIVALLKSLHLDWSPAAIKSAIVTTARTTDPSGEPIFAQGDPMKLADPFDFGGGIVNPDCAADPGLVYNMSTADYVNYLCAKGYNNSSIAQLTEQLTPCPLKNLSVLDVNLPSITIPSLRRKTSLTRTVTNVGTVTSTYKAFVKPPQGINVAVKPDKLIFTSTINTISFTVTVSSTHQVSTGYLFGSLTWTDGVHAVRSPISVRTKIM